MNKDEFIAHYGTPWDGILNSGRYVYGSGKNPYQRALDYRGMVAQMRSSGEFKNDTEIADALGMTSSQFRAFNSITHDEVRKHQIVEAKKLKAKGMSNSAIAEKLGLSSESQVRSLLKQDEQNSQNKTTEIADVLKKQVADKKYLDVGSGVETQLGITSTRLKNACERLEAEGYRTENIRVPQANNPTQKTIVKVLVKVDDPKATDSEIKSDIYKNRDKINSITGVYLEDDGRSIRNVTKPVPVNKDRVMIRYNEEGGVQKDGVIELRRGVEDLSLKNAHYAQVRIDVDDTHYLKGMAVYGDDKEFPKGVDIIFNTNKHVGTDKMDVLKKMKTVSKDSDKVDWNNPFGATIKNDEDLILAQQHYIGKDGKEHQSALNIVNEEGNWGEWKKTIASQMLSKQPVKTADKQLKIAEGHSRLELDEIENLTNPVVKKKLLDDFADNADTAAVELKAAKFPRQASQVLIPINSLKPTEIYAPNYKNGEEVVLVRYPHGGKFEMPKLKVNNRNKEGKEVITPNAKDAVGINHKVAEQLSGADFDGDTVLVIPTKGQNIKVDKAKEKLINFEPKEDYKAYEGMPKVGQKTDGFQKQKQMGMVSNLITDMTIKGAPYSDIERAVMHSMVVIDAEKHNLNWRQSEKDFGIDELKKKYQNKGIGEDGKEKYGGASTLISKASGEKRVNERKDYYKVDPKTGKKIYEETGKAYDEGNKDAKGYAKTIYIGKDGKYYLHTKAQSKDEKYHLTPYTPKGKVTRIQTKTTNMADTDDARTLSSGTQIEEVYARYANSMKAMANEARKASIATKVEKRDPDARLKYAQEVDSLNAKLALSKSNAPKERQAQLIASKTIEMAKKNNPDMDKDDLKKVRTQALNSARRRTGADKYRVEFTPKEWEAIQNNAVSSTMLQELLNNADMDSVRKLATPRDSKELSAAKIARIKALANSNYTNAEIADDIGVSTSTVQKYLSTSNRKE